MLLLTVISADDEEKPSALSQFGGTPEEWQGLIDEMEELRREGSARCNEAPQNKKKACFLILNYIGQFIGKTRQLQEVKTKCFLIAGIIGGLVEKTRRIKEAVERVEALKLQ
ncbi:unnamed protein product, partial [Mesorhabditis spiculigera]